MDTIDRPDSNVPARYAGDSPRLPASIAASSRDLSVASPPTSPQVTPRILMRGLSRHWLRIALLWLVVSTPLAYLIYTMVEPTYEARSLLRAEPTYTAIYGPTMRDSGSKLYLLTQVQLMTSDSVLEAALAKPEISRLPLVKSSKDPMSALREQMHIGIVGDNTYLIQVTLSSKDPGEAADLINAVVEAYRDQQDRYHQNANRALRTKLGNELDKTTRQIEEAQGTLTELVNKGNIALKDRMPLKSNARGDDQALGSFEKVTESKYASAVEELFKIDVELIDAQATLATLQAQLARAQELAAAQGDQKTKLEVDQLESRIREEFKKDPEVRPLIEQFNETKEMLDRVRSLARQSSDPAIVAAVRQHKKLEKQWEALWEQKHDEILARLQAVREDVRPAAWEAKVKDLEARIEQLNQKRIRFTDMIRNLKYDSTTENSDQLKASMLQQELGYLRRLQESVKLKIAQLEFEIGQEAYRITWEKARVPVVPSNNKRMKYMAVAPVGVLFVMLGLFLLVEIKAERVGDPDSLSTRVQSEVYALPPLPTMRSIRRRGPDDADEIEQFIQRLDHLRFAVCGNPAELEKGRCVLITSAIGGEGKTTLAAQLAARCGNAGMSTLLIDADLRRTGLCSLLDVPEGAGLSDALISDETAPTELVIPVQGGTFHLLPAGTPVPDTSRVLQNRKLGLLIAQFRQIYDLVIIDCPPVLPVPDALVLGRWVDGAVLAVRYDISRFPQVERARRQLDAAGIAVLGTVINGMRNTDSYYGRYSYSRRRTPRADSSAAL
jgi:succinoglycan biosynthesis transport protein ExoP